VRGYTVRYDRGDDALSIDFLEDEVGAVGTRTQALDERRIVDLDPDGEPVSIALLEVSRGVDLDGLPEQQVVREVLRLIARMGTD
jgi:hypothetical protein